MKQHTTGFMKICETAREHIKEVCIDEVKQQLESQTQPPFFLIDVREDTEWQQGHLPKAIHLSKGIIERDIEAHIPDYHAKIVVYCGGGYRSALAADNLQKMGYTQVFSMAGGVRAWNSAGYPFEHH
jgi:rhodanese-related sulfurtransferase